MIPIVLLIIQSLIFTGSANVFPQVQVVSAQNYTFQPPEFIIQGSLFYGLEMVNLQTGQQTDLTSLSECGSDTDDFYFTANLDLWCASRFGSTLYLYQLQIPSLSEDEFVTLDLDDFTLLSFLDNALFILPENYLTSLSVKIFDPAQGKVTCKTNSYTFPQGSAFTNYFYNGKDFIYVYLYENMLTFNYIFCANPSPNPIQTTYPFVGMPKQIHLFNNSAVGLLRYDEPYLEDSIGVAFTYSESGKIQFGANAIPMGPISRINEEFFFSVGNSANYVVGKIYYITSALEIVELTSFNLCLDTLTPNASVVQGNNTIWVQLDEETYYIYEIGQRGIIEVNSPYAPLLFANGSTVILTNYGYFMNDKTGVYTFHPVTFSLIQPFMVGSSVVWALTYPSPTATNCSLSYINPAYNDILLNNDNFAKCPPFNSSLQFLDAALNVRGYPTVALGGPFLPLSILFINGSMTQLNFASTYSEYLVTLNLTVNGGVLIGIYEGSILSVVFNFAGPISNTSIQASYQNYIQKISESYYGVINVATESWVYNILESWSSKVVFSQHQAVGFETNDIVPYPLNMMGWNPINPNFYQGLIFIGSNAVGVVGNDVTYSSAQEIQIQAPSTFNFGSGPNSTEFIVMSQLNNFAYQKTIYNVTTWNSTTAEIYE